MEGSALFNPGFLGSSFMWWVGQIADDSTWRDNAQAGVYEDKNAVPGWGRRYKVRIIGLHDQGETEIPSDQLPWANVMYPITAGGFQTNSGQTPNLRQGNMVFGFFLDGQDQQVPVIMGVLGNNSQTTLSQTIGDNSVTNAQAGSIAKSGYATGARSKGSAAEVAPDQDKVVKQPAKQPAAPGSLDATVARENAAVDAALAAEQSKEAGPGAPPQPGATLENESVQQITAGDVKRQEKCEEKIVMMKPDDMIGSAMKGIQTAIENLTKKIDKYLQALQSYVDAVSSTIDSIRNLIMNISQEICKYMKIIFDKIMEYVLKILNKALNAVVAAMPSSLRYQFGDMKEILTELILCLYNKMMEGMCDTIAGALNDAINPDQLEKDANDRANNGVDDNGNLNGAPTNPRVSTCYAEDLVSQVLAGRKSQIDSANNNLVENMNSYLEDVTAQLAGVSGAISGASDSLNSLKDITNLIPDIGGGMAGALTFTNIKLNVFGCELEPNVAVSDFYTFCEAGSGAPPSQLPSEASVAEGVENAAAAPPIQQQQFVEPPKGTPAVLNTDDDLGGPITQAERDAVAQGNIIDEQGNTIGTIS
jgi:archaellum component FlaC